MSQTHNSLLEKYIGNNFIKKNKAQRSKVIVLLQTNIGKLYMRLGGISSLSTFIDLAIINMVNSVGWDKTRNRNDGITERNGKAEQIGDKTRNGGKINDNIRHVILFDVTKHAQKLHHIYLTN